MQTPRPTASRFGLPVTILAFVLLLSCTCSFAAATAPWRCPPHAGGFLLDFSLIGAPGQPLPTILAISDAVRWGDSGLELTAFGRRAWKAAHKVHERQGDDPVYLPSAGYLCAFEPFYPHAAARPWQRPQILGLDWTTMIFAHAGSVCNSQDESQQSPDVKAYCARSTRTPALFAPNTMDAEEHWWVSQLETASSREHLLNQAATFCTELGGSVEVAVVSAQTIERIKNNHNIELATFFLPHVLPLCAFAVPQPNNDPAVKQRIALLTLFSGWGAPSHSRLDAGVEHGAFVSAPSYPIRSQSLGCAWFSDLFFLVGFLSKVLILVLGGVVVLQRIEKRNHLKGIVSTRVLDRMLLVAVLAFGLSLSVWYACGTPQVELYQE